MHDRFRYKPPKTDWIGCELFISYDCDSKPTVDKLVITGIKQLGFIISHEYEIEAFVQEVEREKCNLSSCERATKYSFHVEFYVFDKIGLGFGLGSGTGTLGYTFKPENHKTSFTTRCICCDQDPKTTQEHPVMAVMRRLIEMQSRREDHLATVAGITALSTGCALALIHLANPLSRLFLLSVGLATAIFGGLAIWRLRNSLSGRGSSTPDPHKLNKGLPQGSR